MPKDPEEMTDDELLEAIAALDEEKYNLAARIQRVLESERSGDG